MEVDRRASPTWHILNSTNHIQLRIGLAQLPWRVESPAKCNQECRQPRCFVPEERSDRRAKTQQVNERFRRLAFEGTILKAQRFFAVKDNRTIIEKVTEISQANMPFSIQKNIIGSSRKKNGS